MAKVTLEFDSIEEADDLKDALNGSNWKHLVWKFDQELRAVTKYGASRLDPSKEASNIEIEVCTKLRETLRDLLSNYELRID